MYSFIDLQPAVSDNTTVTNRSLEFPQPLKPLQKPPNSAIPKPKKRGPLMKFKKELIQLFDPSECLFDYDYPKHHINQSALS